MAWSPIAGGSLSMIAGIWNIIIGSGILLGNFILDTVSPSFLWAGTDFALTGTSAGILLVALGAVSTIGGMFAVGRRWWGLALIGAIAALVPSPVILPFVMGIFAVIFVSHGRPEFHRGERRI